MFGPSMIVTDPKPENDLTYSVPTRVEGHRGPVPARSKRDPNLLSARLFDQNNRHRLESAVVGILHIGTVIRENDQALIGIIGKG